MFYSFFFYLIKMISKSLEEVKTCVIGNCNSESKLTLCQHKRDDGVSISRFDFNLKREKEDSGYFNIFNERFNYIRLFNEFTEKIKHPKIELHDIVVHLKITSYHQQKNQRENRIKIPIKKELITGKEELNITAVLNSLVIKFFIIEICDKDTAEQRQPSMNDIIVDRDIQDIQFREYIKPIVSTELKIDCEGCEFQTHDVIMCLDLKELKVCKLNSDQIPNLFDKGNYALVFFIDYFDHFFKFKDLKQDKDNPWDKLGEDFNT
jgi:hypothetical protein